MNRNTLAVLFCIALFSLTIARAQSDDSLQIQPISPLPAPRGNDLIIGHKVSVNANVNYQLTSVDGAIVAIYVEEFPSSAGGCTGNTHQTNGGNYYSIQRGTGQISATVVWRGDNPFYKQGGYFALGANLWTADRKQKIKSFGLLTSVCYHFFPNGGVPID